MDTIKTAIVVVLLLAVLYGVYVVLNKPESSPPPEVAWEQSQHELAPPDISFGGPEAIPAPVQPPSSPGTPITQPSLPAGPQGAVAADGSASAYSPLPENPHASPEFNPIAKDPSQPPAADSHYAGGAANPPDEPARPHAADSEVAPSSDPQSSHSHDAHPDAHLGASQPSTTPPEDSIQPSPPVATRETFEKALRSAKSLIANQQYREALFTLSLLFSSSDVSDDQHRQLLDWLDPLAAKVVYSRDHLLAGAHVVGRGETLMDVGRQYRVPWELLQNINGIENPKVLVPGTELKVVPGPFRAEVDLTKGELILFAGRLYAGRFPITVGRDPMPKTGQYTIKDKQPGRTYYAPDGRNIPASSPQNPYGDRWLDLGGELCIHGSPPAQNQAVSSGCISLSPIDARDVYSILAEGSRIVIRR